MFHDKVSILNVLLFLDLAIKNAGSPISHRRRVPEGISLALGRDAGAGGGEGAGRGGRDDGEGGGVGGGGAHVGVVEVEAFRAGALLL